MRDPKRIDRVLATIREAWGKAPDWRLGQLLVNAVGVREPCPELFHVEDDQLMQLVARLSEGKTMTRHAFNVTDTFEIPDRGVVVVTNRRYEELPAWLALKVGDTIELRSEGHTVRTSVAGLEFLDPWTPQTLFGFLLPDTITHSEIPRNCEIWVTESNVFQPSEEA